MTDIPFVSTMKSGARFMKYEQASKKPFKDIIHFRPYICEQWSRLHNGTDIVGSLHE